VLVFRSYTATWYEVAPAAAFQSIVGVVSVMAPLGPMRVGTAGA
jgi:hypothetical protein